MTDKRSPGELFAEVLTGNVTPGEAPPPGPRVPAPNPAQGHGGNAVPDPNADQIAFVRALQNAASNQSPGPWTDIQTGIRSR
jgi:hypothetical protein